MAHNLDDKDICKLRKLFTEIDDSHDGYITAVELRDYFKEVMDNKNLIKEA